MGRQKSKREWLLWFKKYESGKIIWSKYYEDIRVSGTKKSFSSARDRFKQKYKKYKISGSSIIISMSGRKSTGRRKKMKIINWDDFTRGELVEIAKRYQRIIKDKRKNCKDKEIISLNISKLKLSWLLNVSRSGLYYKKKTYSKRDVNVEKIISKTFKRYKGIFGRDRIAGVTGLNYRRVGRYLKGLGLACQIRRPKRKSERKNTNTKFKDLVNRDYDRKNVIATDVSYILTSEGFAYLSIAIEHYTKKILSWNFTKENTNELVINHFKNLDLKGK